MAEDFEVGGPPPEESSNRTFLYAAGGIGLLIPPGGAIAYSWLANAIGGAVSALIIVAEWRRGRKTVALA